MTDGVSKAIAIAKKVAKQVPKVLAVGLPALTVGVNVMESHATFPNTPSMAFQDFVERYTGVDTNGVFNYKRAMLGTGRLLIAGVAGWALKQLA